uniref:SCP domain-containing protein n=1 Tax=Heterorhabditis bacteriophora TaxID=37862 RepID=A0A1I7WXR0_HETBA
MEIRRRHERDSQNSWQLIKQQSRDDCMRWGKFVSSENGYHLNYPNIAFMGRPRTANNSNAKTKKVPLCIWWDMKVFCFMNPFNQLGSAKMDRQIHYL